jgi:hypothetical protein
MQDFVSSAMSKRSSLSADPRFALNAICPYFTMFPLEFPLRVLKRHPDARVVIDPYCGRGTTLFAARVRGLHAYGIDCSPVAVAISQAKLATVNLLRSLSLARDLIAKHQTVRIPEGAFWSRAFHKSTLRDICALRRGLLREPFSDCSAILRAAVLGCLHGPLTGTNSYLSNQMPRTFAPKPNYALHFWKERALTAPRADVLKALRRKLLRIAQEDRHAGIRCDGRIYEGDASEAETFRGVRKKIDLAITSPAYYGMRTYVPDQWLRNWFLGGPAEVDYSFDGSLPSSSPSDFIEALGRTWSHLARHANDEFHLYVRFGSIPSRAIDSRKVFVDSLASSGHRWRVVSFRGAATADAGKRQVQQMDGHAEAQREFDVHVILV